jgi:SAM-dependent methyltransferase
MDNYKTAERFWTSIDKYPPYPNVLVRRLIDTNFISDRIQGSNSILDIGCGDGSMLLSLREFTDIGKFYGFDISNNLLSILRNKWGSYRKLIVEACNVLEINSFPHTDVTISLGFFPYIFNDSDIEDILDKIKSNIVIIRVPCSVGNDAEVINKYSAELNSDYSAIYRTFGKYEELISKKFKINEVSRAYPDSIESKYGTKHYFLVCSQ